MLMKRLKIFALLMIAAACTKPAADISEEVISISVPQSTKVHINDLKTCWDKGDAVTVFYKNENPEQWIFKGKTGDTTGPVSHTSISRNETRNDIFVLYPYDADAVLENRTISTEIPSAQDYRKDSYGTAVLASRSYSNFMTMKYCTAIVELRFTGEADISHICLAGRDKEKICGQSTISFEDEIPELTCAGDTLVTLSCNTAVEQSQTVSFYFSIAPGTFSKGLAFTIYLKNGEKHRVISSEEITVQAGHIHTIEASSPALPYNQKVMHLLFSDGQTAQHPFTENITFTRNKRLQYKYELDGKLYNFYLYCQKNDKYEFRNTNRGGLYIGGTEGDYIEFPALPDYTLQSIGISVNKESYFHITPVDSPDETIPGGTCTSIQDGDFRILHLSGTEVSKAYTMWMDNNCVFRFITLYFRK